MKKDEGATQSIDSASPNLNLSGQERETEENYHNLVALSRVSAAISGLHDLNAILGIGLDNVLDIMKGNIGGIMLLDGQTKTLSYRVYHGLSAKYVEEMRVKLGEGIAGNVAQNGKSILLEDISSEPEAAHIDLINIEGLKSFVSVPLRARDNVLGVMNVASHVSHYFTRRDMHLLHSIGDQLGIAIAQARLYKTLSNARERYQTLLRQSLTIQEEERKRIARELHDETSQDLTALALNLQAAIEMLEVSNVEGTEIRVILRRAHTIAVHAGAEITKIIRELRPTLLDTLGLPAAIHNLAETNLTSKGINVSTEFEGMNRRLSPETELSFFRIIQEAMSNIVRHSEAKNVTIRLECDANKCVLRMEDDGKGFNVNEITGIDQKGRGAGLFGMKERITLVGGECVIKSQPGEGTKIISKVPIVKGVTHAEDKSISGR